MSIPKLDGISVTLATAFGFLFSATLAHAAIRANLPSGLDPTQYAGAFLEAEASSSAANQYSSVGYAFATATYTGTSGDFANFHYFQDPGAGHVTNAALTWNLSSLGLSAGAYTVYLAVSATTSPSTTALMNYQIETGIPSNLQVVQGPYGAGSLPSLGDAWNGSGDSTTSWWSNRGSINLAPGDTRLKLTFLEAYSSTLRVDALYLQGSPVPEPSTYAAAFGVLSLGAALLGRRRRGA